MGKITQSEINQNCRDAALKLLIKHDEPTLRDAQEYICRHSHCPVERCNHPGGINKGMECGYVLKIKHLINRVLAIADEQDRST